MPVEQAVYNAAKVSAARAGMLFRKWVERAIADACDKPEPVHKAGETMRLREPARETTYEPISE